MPPNEKRKKSVKLDPNVVQTKDKNAVRTGHVVCVTCVPTALCASERTVKAFFSEYGTLLSVTIHHNFLDMEPDGFMYLEYAEKDEAEAAIAAVKDKVVGLGVPDAQSKKAVLAEEITGMEATLALPRGEPKFDADEGMKDVLLGRLEMNRFTQSQQSQAMDEDDLILQSLSQHSFATSQPKKKKRHKRSDNTLSVKPKKPKQSKRSNKIAIPTE
ncbi:DNA binding protein [Phytophthora megakarya]|uniref:DNA binding protein n=1 Tax=Phytophthora megakarya TaxID=4795 RepID=A0A225WPD3_9STRA|nr:DNA binding protein [Phytophthora megakarya]